MSGYTDALKEIQKLGEQEFTQKKKKEAPKQIQPKIEQQTPKKKPLSKIQQVPLVLPEGTLKNVKFRPGFEDVPVTENIGVNPKSLGKGVLRAGATALNTFFLDKDLIPKPNINKGANEVADAFGRVLGVGSFVGGPINALASVPGKVAAKALPKAPSILKGAAQGAADVAAYETIRSMLQKEKPKDMGKDIALGALAGGAVGAGISKILDVLKPVQKVSERKAPEVIKETVKLIEAPNEKIAGLLPGRTPSTMFDLVNEPAELVKLNIQKQLPGEKIAGLLPEPQNFIIVDEKPYIAKKTIQKTKQIMEIPQFSNEEKNIISKYIKKGNEIEHIIDTLKDERRKKINMFIEGLKSEGRQGREKGGLIFDDSGQVVGGYKGFSKNAPWYRQFYKTYNRPPNKKEIYEIALNQLRNGYIDEAFGYIPPDDEFLETEKVLNFFKNLNDKIKITRENGALELLKAKPKQAEKTLLLPPPAIREFELVGKPYEGHLDDIKKISQFVTKKPVTEFEKPYITKAKQIEQPLIFKTKKPVTEFEKPYIPKNKTNELTNIEPQAQQAEQKFVTRNNKFAEELINEAQKFTRLRDGEVAGIIAKGFAVNDIPQNIKAGGKLEEVLTAKTKPSELTEKLKEKLDSIKTGFEEIFSYRPNLKDNPKAQNDFRLFEETPQKAKDWAFKMIYGITAPLKNNKEYEIFRRIVVLEDLKSTAEQGLPLPLEVDSGEVVKELNKLYSIAPDTVKLAVKNHFDAMQAIGEELVQRGKMSGIRDKYFPHRVMDYVTNLDFYIPDEKIKAPYRYYTKQREGSIGKIDTDYFEVMTHHLKKVFMDNAKDDFIEKIASRYDKSNLYKDIAHGRVYMIKGKRYIGWQYNPGNIYYEATSIPEKIAQQAVAEGFANVQADKLKNIIAVGKRNKTYLLPEEVAKELNNINQKTKLGHLQKSLIHATNLWKRVTLDLAGIPYQMQNFIGDLLNLYREDVGAFTKIPAAIKLLKQGGPLLEKAQEQAVLTSGMFEYGISGKKAQKELQRLYSPIKSQLNKINPLVNMEILSNYREAIPRLSLFLKNIERFEAGKPLISKTVDIRGLEGEEAAGKIAREALVDYGKISNEYRDTVRGVLFPFITFYTHNFANWAKYVRQHPGEFAVKFGIPFAAMFIYNNTHFPKIEKDLPDYYKYMPHIITPYKTEDGRQLIIAMADPATLAGEVVGLDRLTDKAGKVMQGEMTVKEAVKEQAKDTLLGPGRVALQLLNPIFKTGLELSANKNFYTGEPIVPERLKGTKEEKKLLAMQALGNIITPVGGMMRSARSPEPGSTIEKYLFKGPLDVKRSLGIREVNIEAARRNKEYEAKEKETIAKRQAKYELEQAFIKYKIGKMGLEQYLNEKREAKKSLSDRQIKNIEKSDRVKIAVLKEQLKVIKDPKQRKEVNRRIQKLYEKERL